MKKQKYIYGLFVLCIIIGLISPIKSMAKVDPLGIFLDETGNPRNRNISSLDWRFLNIKIELMMELPDFYPGLDIDYDQVGTIGESMEECVSLQTRGKIVIYIRDTREFYSSIEKKDELLEYLDRFKYELKFKLIGITNNFDNDVVIYVIPKEGWGEGGLLAYFYKGEFIILKDLP